MRTRRVRQYPVRRLKHHGARVPRFEPLEHRQLLAADLLFTELVADNDASLRDRDGDAEDWMEIHNSTNETINLLGWSLTDDRNQLDKWQFPYLNLEAGHYLVVFASGKDRSEDAFRVRSDFHATRDGTFFVNLNDGTYDVRLTMGDSESIRDNMEVYIQGALVETVSVDAGVFVSKTYTANVSAASGGQLSIRLKDAGGISTRVAINGLIITPQSAGDPMRFDFGPAGSPVEPGFVGVIPSNTYSAALGYGWDAAAAPNAQNRGLDFDELHTNFKLSEEGEYLALVNPEGVVQEFAPGYPEQRLNYSYGLEQGFVDSALLAVAAPARVLIPSVANGGSSLGTTWTQPGFNDATWTSGVTGIGYERGTGFEPLIATDVEFSMFDVSASAFIRIPFMVTDRSEIPSLVLRMKYNDGFVAYLNGVEVARRNAPSIVTASSRAPFARSEEQSLEFEEINLFGFLDLVQDGQNVLAIHGLNVADDSDDFLIVPELLARSGTPIESQVLGYFAAPTPGAANGAESLEGLAASPGVSVDRGFYDDPFDLAVSSTTGGATIIYTTDGSTPSLANGTQVPAPDAATAPSLTLHVSSNTLLRAATFKDGLVPSPVITHTYLFPEDVVGQSQQRALDAGFPATWTPDAQPGSGIRGDYEMDSDVVGPNDLFGGEFASQMVESLKAVPSLSIVTDLDNLFGSERGIYVWSTRREANWATLGLSAERPTSVELIYPDGTNGFQVPAGLRIQGDNSRQHTNAKKHSFRISFRQQYGYPKLEYPFFGDQATDRFDQLVLRANYNDGMVHSPWSSQHIRDEWARATQIDMGQISSHGTFMHVYLNGLYWGLYNVIEHPDASFGEAYFGGDKDEWDAIDTGRPVDGTLETWGDLQDLASAVADPDLQQSNAAFQRMLGNNPDGTDNPAFETMLDVDNYIDYLIMNLYGGNVDWPGRNWYAARRRGPESTGFKFFGWDTEKIIDHGEGSDLNTNRIDVNDGVATVYALLRNNAEFRLMFADRLQKHFFNGGALYVDPENPAWDPAHPERNVPSARFDRLAQFAELPLVAESARWGDVEGGPRFIYRAEPSLIVPTSPVRYVVPRGDASEAGWQNPEFDDSSWIGGQAAVGYDSGVADVYMDTHFTVRAARSRGVIDSLSDADALLAGFRVASETTVTGVPVINYIDGYIDGVTDGHFVGSQPFPLGRGDNFAIRATATLVVNVEDKYTIGIHADDGARVRIDGQDVIVDDRLTDPGNTLPDPEDKFATLFLTAGPHEIELVKFDSTGNAKVELYFARGQHLVFNNNFLLLGEETNVPFAPQIHTDIEAGMHGTSSSVYVRVPFMATDVAHVDRLQLHMRHSDGFVAYLNGQEVARSGALDAIQVNVGFTVRALHSTGVIDSLSSADALLASADATPAGSDVASDTTVLRVPNINYIDGGEDAHYAPGQPFPGGGGDNFVVRATARMKVNLAGEYTFGINTDDGARLRIDGEDVIVVEGLAVPGDRFGMVFLTAGDHELELVKYDTTAEAGVELFLARGNFSSFNNSFLLLGGEGAPAFDSTATVDRLDRVAVATSTFDISRFTHLLREGNNILTIHGLNSSADDPDFLLVPQLEPLSSREFTLIEFNTQRDSQNANYFPRRSDIVLNQFLAGRLYRHLDAPQFNQHGGQIPPGFSLSMTSSDGIGEMYYTLDGSDPRLSSFGRESEGATIADTAVRYIDPIVLTERTVVKARTFVRAGDLDLNRQVDIDDVDALVLGLNDPAAYAALFGVPPSMGGDTTGDQILDFDDLAGFAAILNGTGNVAFDGYWSALVEATFEGGPSPVRISEIMYHPQDPPAGSSREDDDYEYIELVNVSNTATVVLDNMAFTRGIQFTFPPMTSLAPGEHIVVVRNREAFQERYGTEIRIAGQYGGTPDDLKLDNGGETLRLEDAQGRVIHEFAYDDGWYTQTDGPGYSLEIVDPYTLPLEQWGVRESWQASTELGGTPGGARLSMEATRTLAFGSQEIVEENGDFVLGLNDTAPSEALFSVPASPFGLEPPLPGDTDGDGDVDFDDIAATSDRDWTVLVDILMRGEV